MGAHLTEDGDVVDAVIVGQGLNKPVAKARFSGANRAFFFFATGQSDHSD